MICFTRRRNCPKQNLKEKGKVAYTPISDIHPENTDPVALVAGKATPTDATHIAAPMTRVKVIASRGTNGNAARVSSADAMAFLLMDRVGEKGRRA